MASVSRLASFSPHKASFYDAVWTNMAFFATGPFRAVPVTIRCPVHCPIKKIKEHCWENNTSLTAIIMFNLPCSSSLCLQDELGKPNETTTVIMLFFAIIS